MNHLNLKPLLLCMLTLLHLSANAYSDHRNAKVDSLETVLKTKGTSLSDEERLRIYGDLVRGYLGRDTKKHTYYCREALALTYKLNGLNMRENILYQMGLSHYGRDEFEQAERYFQWALAVTDSMVGDKRYKASDIDDNRSQLYGALGNLYNVQDKALLAIDYYQKALPIFEKHGWLESQTILHHNVAELWLSMGNNDKAKAEYQKAIETGNASGDSLMMVLPRKGLVKVWMNEGDYEQARQTLLPAYEYYRAHQQEEHNDYAVVLAGMTKLCLMEGHEDLPKAEAYAKEALTLDDGMLMTETRCDIYAAATMVEMQRGRWQQALEYALKSVHENDSDATFSDVGCYELLANIYMQLGQKEKARLYIKKVRTMMERFSTHNYQSGLSQMEVLYQTKEKEAQIKALNKEQNLFRWLLAATIGLLAALALILVFRLQAHRRQKALLAAKVSLDTETKERSILARDLHDSLGSMLSLLRLKLETKDEEALPLLDKTIVELRRTAHHLMPEELLKGGLSSALHDFAVSIPGASFQTVGEIHLSKEIELVLYRCAYELVNNAIKHAQASHINIQLMQEPQQVTLSVGDDGTGTKTMNEGMGLKNIRERIATYNGTVNMVSTEENGTEINITLPL